MSMRTHGNMLDCNVDELLEVAATAASYRDSPSGTDTNKVLVRLFLERDQVSGLVNYRAGSVTRAEASQVLSAFDPDGSIQRASNEHSVAYRSYYRSAAARAHKRR